MHDAIDALQSAVDLLCVADVSVERVRRRRQRGRAALVYLRLEAVEHDDLVARSTSVRTRCEPMKPHPPVTSVRMLTEIPAAPARRYDPKTKDRGVKPNRPARLLISRRRHITVFSATVSRL